jgi:hypothetical protein
MCICSGALSLTFVSHARLLQAKLCTRLLRTLFFNGRKPREANPTNFFAQYAVTLGIPMLFPECAELPRMFHFVFKTFRDAGVSPTERRSARHDVFKSD